MNQNTKTKICAKCKVEKPLDEKHFYRNFLNADTYEGQCRECRKKAADRSKARRKAREEERPYLHPKTDAKPITVGKYRI